MHIPAEPKVVRYIILTLHLIWLWRQQRFEDFQRAKQCLSAVICLGEDVRRYLTGPPGPQGPPGQPGTSGGHSVSYNYEDIATYVIKVLNGERRVQKTEKQEPWTLWLDQSIKLLLLTFSDRGMSRGPPGPPGPVGPVGPAGPAGSAVSGGQGYTTATIDYTALMRSESDAILLFYLFFHKNSGTHSSSFLYLHHLRPRLPHLD